MKKESRPRCPSASQALRSHTLHACKLEEPLQEHEPYSIFRKCKQHPEKCSSMGSLFVDVRSQFVCRRNALDAPSLLLPKCHERSLLPLIFTVRLPAKLGKLGSLFVSEEGTTVALAPAHCGTSREDTKTSSSVHLNPTLRPPSFFHWMCRVTNNKMNESSILQSELKWTDPIRKSIPHTAHSAEVRSWPFISPIPTARLAPRPLYTTGSRQRQCDGCPTRPTCKLSLIIIEPVTTVSSPQASPQRR